MKAKRAEPGGNKLIIPWEGLVLQSHWDGFVKIWDICYGETRINGKPVTAGMSFTQAECLAMLKVRVIGCPITALKAQLERERQDTLRAARIQDRAQQRAAVACGSGSSSEEGYDEKLEETIRSDTAPGRMTISGCGPSSKGRLIK